MNKRKLIVKHLSVDEIVDVIDCSVTLGVNSIFEVTDGNIVIDHIDGLDDGEPTLYIKPLPNIHSLEGTIRITDTDNPCLSPDYKEIYLTQENGILFDSEYYSINHESSPCCSNNFSTYEPPIVFECGDWIKKTEVSCFNDKGLVVEGTSLGVVNITQRPYEDVYDEPIYVNGYDGNNNLIAASVFYLSYIYTKNDCNDDEDSNDDDIELFVTPSKIIIPNEDYNDLDSIDFNYYLMSTNAEVEITVDGKDFDSDNNISCKHNNCSVNFRNYLRKRYETNEDITENTTVTVGFKTSHGFKVEREILLLPYKNKVVSTIQIYVNDEIKKPISSFEFETDNYLFTVDSSLSWYIEDYPMDILFCSKSDDRHLSVTLLDKSGISSLDNVYITLRNDDGASCSLQIMSKDLQQSDEYVMEWEAKELDKKYNCEVNYYDALNTKTAVGTFISTEKLAINNNEAIYGEWTVVSSKNVNYIVKQRINKEWVTIDSSVVGTWTNNNDENDYKLNVYIHNHDAVSEGEYQDYDVIVYTNDTFSTETTGYVEFYQVSGEASIKLTITHPRVVKYNIYTDQEGSINFSVN